MTHCAIVPFITVAHIHIKHILTFSLILECVLEFLFFLTCTPPPLFPIARPCLQLAQHHQEYSTCPTHLLV